MNVSEKEGALFRLGGVLLPTQSSHLRCQSKFIGHICLIQRLTHQTDLGCGLTRPDTVVVIVVLPSQQHAYHHKETNHQRNGSNWTAVPNPPDPGAVEPSPAINKILLKMHLSTHSQIHWSSPKAKSLDSHSPGARSLASRVGLAPVKAMGHAKLSRIFLYPLLLLKGPGVEMFSDSTQS